MRAILTVVLLVVACGATAVSAQADWEQQTALTAATARTGPAPGIAPLRRGALVVHTLERPGGGSQLFVDTLAADGTRLARQTLGDPAPRIAARVFTNTAGSAVAVWSATLGLVGRQSGTGRVFVASRDSGGRFGPPTAVSSATSRGPRIPQDASAGVDRAGRVVAVWSRLVGRQRRIQLAEGTADGRWSPVRNISPADRRAFFPRLAVGADGSALVAWGTSRGSTVLLHRRGVRFGPPRELPNTFVDGVTLTDDGRGLLAVQQLPARQISAITVAADGALGEPQVISPVDANRASLDMDGAGNAVIAWERRIPDPDLREGGVFAIEAASRSAAGPFARPETIAPRSFNLSASPFPQVAVGRNGGASIVFGDDAGVSAAVRRDNQPFSAPVRIEPADGQRHRVDFGWATTVDSAGAAVAVWPRVVRSQTTQLVSTGTG